MGRGAVGTQQWLHSPSKGSPGTGREKSPEYGRDMEAAGEREKERRKQLCIGGHDQMPSGRGEKTLPSKPLSRTKRGRRCCELPLVMGASCSLHCCLWRNKGSTPRHLAPVFRQELQGASCHATLKCHQEAVVAGGQQMAAGGLLLPFTFACGQCN